MYSTLHYHIIMSTDSNSLQCIQLNSLGHVFLVTLSYCCILLCTISTDEYIWPYYTTYI